MPSEVTSYAMFTKTGNRRVQTMVDRLKKELERGEWGPKKVATFLRGKMDGIATKHGEVWDTAVREAIFADLDAACREYGYKEIEL